MKDLLAARAAGTLKPVPPPAASAPFTLADIPAYAASRQAKAPVGISGLRDIGPIALHG